MNAFPVKIVTIIIERKEGKWTDRLPFGTIQNAASWRSIVTEPPSRVRNQFTLRMHIVRREGNL